MIFHFSGGRHESGQAGRIIIGFWYRNHASFPAIGSAKRIASNQICKSGTSIGANIREARYAQSKADFISKLQIALKETHETYYWLELLKGAELLSEDGFSRLSVSSNELRVMLIASINTAKGRKTLNEN